MVRGNWQRRVEKTQARRQEAKQKKQKSEEKRAYKAMAQELLALLDKHHDVLQWRIGTSKHKKSSSTATASSSWEFHVWTDSLPATSPPLLDILENGELLDDGGGGGKTTATRRARSASIEEDPIDNSKSRGRKSKGKAAAKGDKKVHPRSKEAADTAAAAAASEANHDNASSFTPHLCRSQFFHGKCLDSQQQKGGGGKKSGGSCRCFHYNQKQFPTLCQVLLRNHHHTTTTTGNRADDPKTVLKTAELACADATYQDDSIEPDSGSMDMVYYLNIPTSTTSRNNNHHQQSDTSDGTGTTDDAPSNNLLSDVILSTLNTNSCSIASIVYLVLSSPSHDVLLYDRHQEGGIVVSDLPAQISPGKTMATDQSSQDLFHAEHLPISILEHILAHVEAETVAAAHQVCKAWHRELGNASPNLWKHLLLQRSWPFPTAPSVTTNNTPNSHDDDGPNNDTSSSSAAAAAKRLKDEFIQHYSVLRDMRALQSALSSLLTKKFPEEREMTFQAFSTRRGAPQAPNNCVAVEIWGPNHVLAAYSNDCTLRLFQAVPKQGTTSSTATSGHSHNNNHHSLLIEKVCRETVCMCIDPYKNTKRKSCFMEAIGLDEDVVGCLCSVSDEASDYKTPHILVIISRDDLLVVDNTAASGHVPEPEEGALRVIDLEEAVLNYLLSLDQVDHNLLRLHDFLALGGEMEDVELIVSQSMAACGYGRFMVEVAISIPLPDNNQGEDEDDHGGTILLDRKLFLFSSSLEAIVWYGNSNPSSEPPRPRLEDMTLCSYRSLQPGGGTRTSCTVAAVSHAYAPVLASCEIDPSGQIEAGQPLGSLEWAQEERRILAEEGWTVRIEGSRPIVISPTDVVVGDTLTRQPEQNDALREYKSLLTFYSRYPSTRDEEELPCHKLLIGENCLIDRMVGFRDDYIIVLCRSFLETGHAAIDGGGGHWGGEMNRVARVYAITIHIPSRREIERLWLYEDYGFNKLTLSATENTVACGVWLKGLILTGSDVRSVGATDSSAPVMLEDASPAKASKKKGGKKRQSKGGKKDAFARGMSLRG